MMESIIEYIEPLLRGEDLSFVHAEQVLDTVFAGEVAEAQIAAFLTAMRIKGIGAEELAGLAKSLRSHAVKVETGLETLVDTCGTGGSGVSRFNISTAAGLVAAGAGVYVAKHGNRAITSKCGSADVLAELGVKIDANAKVIAECIKQAHIGFMFAPMFHPAMKYVQPIRKALGFRTVFNILGPLANPAGATAQVMGVPDGQLMRTIAESLGLLGTKYAMIVSCEGMDEISTSGVTNIIELRQGKITEKQLDPAELGFAKGNIADLQVDDAKSSAGKIKDIVEGKQGGVSKDVVVVNAAAAIIAGGLADDFEAAIKIADDSIVSGAAKAALEKLIEVSNS